MTLLLLLGMPLVLAVNAHAYLDPSATTYVIQIIAAVIIASGATLTIYWKKIRLYFKNKKRKQP